MADSIVPQAQIVELLDSEQRPYQEVWGATLHCAQQLLADEVGYWLGLYRIKRDMLWREASFDDQESWIGELARLPRFQGGCPESTFHEKMKIIEDLVDAGVSHEMIVHALTQPTATKILLRNSSALPAGQTVGTVLEQTVDQNPGQAAHTVQDILGLKKVYVSSLVYHSREQKLVMAISEEDGADVDVRRYVTYDIPYEDADVLARAVHKPLEMK
jgi:hypothetical protein